MSVCKDCIHEKVCDALIKDGLPWNDGEYPAEAFCMEFRNKADVVKVVRCKDCKHNVANWQHDELDAEDYTDIVCDRFMTDGMEANDYCSYGERK